jgi:uncharacterized membrane protein
MYEDFKQILSKSWEEHPGKTTGIGLGFLAGCAILLFGFWQILFLLVCVAAGLYIGTKFDRGDEILHRLARVLPEKFQRW